MSQFPSGQPPGSGQPPPPQFFRPPGAPPPTIPAQGPPQSGQHGAPPSSQGPPPVMMRPPGPPPPTGTPQQPTSTPPVAPAMFARPPVSAPPPSFVPPPPASSQPPPPPPQPSIPPPPTSVPPTTAQGVIGGGAALAQSRRMYPQAQQPPARPDQTQAAQQQRQAAAQQQQQPMYTPASVTQQMSTMSMGDQSRPQQQQPAAAPRPTTQQLHGHLPPSATCSKSFMRMTCNSLPNSGAIASKWMLPIGCLVRPLAPILPGQPPVQVLDQPGVLIRCMECRAYINPFVSFQEGGRRWVCNICNVVNEVPPAYHQTVDMRQILSGDFSARPELSCATVEFVATKDYMFRAPQPPAYLFVIDVTQQAVASGMVAVVAAAIKQSLDHLAQEERTQIGFITFDSTLHFYNLKPHLSQPQMLVVTDLVDVFIPLPGDLLVNLVDSRRQVEMLLEKLPTMFASNLNIDACYGSAVDAALKAIKNIGGKVITFLHSLPGVGLGKLVNREDKKLINTDKEKSLLTPADDYYKTVAVAASGSQVAFDQFLFCDGYIDAATLCALPQYTAGQQFYYPQFRAVLHGEKLGVDIMDLLMREQGFEAVLRVRCSKGLRVENYYGHYFRRSTDLLTLANVDSNKTYAIELRMEDATITAPVIYLQAALLYTVPSGVRRIRTHTIAIPVTSNLADMYRYADVEATLNMHAKMAVDKTLAGGPQAAREWLVKRCVETLKNYRSYVSTQAKTSPQLVLPETLKLLPIYTLALIKHRAFRAGVSVLTDERTYAYRTMSTLSSEHMVPFVYATAYQAWPYPDNASEIPELPPTVGLSMERFNAQGAFLLSDCSQIFLWLGSAIDPTFLDAVFGVRTWDELTVQRQVVVPQPNPISQRLWGLIALIRQFGFEHQVVHVVKQGEISEQKVLPLLVDDKSAAMMSYGDFLNYLHKTIQQ
eukprot:TRINITY_DN5550_c0_g1_i1.p1 TRINITY_DN5550_c0_g1~~TRINITY_DN5550_c0_g1_i1.p1  ORF type:complete len:954 (+),score=203.14 TRINITY_DN5550_c0_g1_i1:57-2864(+)